MYLIVVDTMQIQPYIFGSNRLRENLGASYLVAQTTEAWAKQYIPEPNNLKPNGTYNPRTESPFNAQRIDGGAPLAAEVVYAGGGNFVALIRDESDAKKFVRGLSRRVMEDAPGLQLLIDCHAFQWSASLVRAIREAFERLAEQKRKRVQTAPLLGVGVTTPCQGTGLPAVEWATPIEGETGYPASAEICAKLNAVDAANAELEKLFGDLLEEKYKFPYDLDKLGRSKGEFSHLAIAHADGDSMSAHFHAIGEEYLAPEKNGAYIIKVREQSEAVKRNSRNALRKLAARLIAQIDPNENTILYNVDGRRLAKIELQSKDKDKSKRLWLPFRPIVFGGDDLTFVCDGRLGLALAAEYLQLFQTENAALGATACAGAAVIKTHYPFARGYALAEQLCQSAKKYRAANERAKVCALDWHFALSGLAGDLDEIREREYKTRAGWLHLRPVTLTHQEPPPLQSWQATERLTREFQGKDWITRRNKVKALRDALRQGETAVQRFRDLYLRDQDHAKLLPDGFAAHPQQEKIRETGWVELSNGDARAVYFDALELADWYMPLKPLEKQP